LLFSGFILEVEEVARRDCSSCFTVKRVSAYWQFDYVLSGKEGKLWAWRFEVHVPWAYDPNHLLVDNTLIPPHLCATTGGALRECMPTNNSNATPTPGKAAVLSMPRRIAMVPGRIVPPRLRLPTDVDLFRAYRATRGTGLFGTRIWSSLRRISSNRRLYSGPDIELES
jgi:hypothetical protein